MEWNVMVALSSQGRRVCRVLRLDNVRDFLVANGFVHRRANDYFHPGIKIILEDLHDENVLTKEGCLMFIDTVFYLMPDFWD